MALADYAITSLANVKDYLAIPTATISDHDSFIETLIDRTSGFMEQYCQRVFTIQSFENEIHNGNGRAKIRTLYYPITQLSVASSPSDADKLASVQVRDDVDSAWENLETDVDHIIINSPPDYLLTIQNSHNIELLDEEFPLGTRNVKLSYKAGLSGKFLAEIEQLCIELVVKRFKDSKKGDNRFGLNSTSDSLGGVSSYNTSYRDLTKEQMEVLNRYKRKF